MLHPQSTPSTTTSEHNVTASSRSRRPSPTIRNSSAIRSSLGPRPRLPMHGVARFLRRVPTRSWRLLFPPAPLPKSMVSFREMASARPRSNSTGSTASRRSPTRILVPRSPIPAAYPSNRVEAGSSTIAALESMLFVALRPTIMSPSLALPPRRQQQQRLQFRQPPPLSFSLPTQRLTPPQPQRRRHRPRQF